MYENLFIFISYSLKNTKKNIFFINKYTYIINTVIKTQQNIKNADNKILAKHKNILFI